MHNFQALGVVGALIKLFVVMDATGEHDHGMTGLNNSPKPLKFIDKT